MKDRVPLYPGRVKLTPVSGQENTYDMVRADEPTQEGDPLSKATFLKDDTAALFGLDATAVPDDALALIKQLIDSNYSELSSLVNSKAKIVTGSYTGTGTYGSSNPNSLTFNGKPLYFQITFSTHNNKCYAWGYDSSSTTKAGVPFNIVSSTYTNDGGIYWQQSSGSSSYGKLVDNTFYWYSDGNYAQFNASGITYYWIALLQN